MPLAAFHLKGVVDVGFYIHVAQTVALVTGSFGSLELARPVGFFCLTRVPASESVLYQDPRESCTYHSLRSPSLPHSLEK